MASGHLDFDTAIIVSSPQKFLKYFQDFQIFDPTRRTF